MMVYEGVGDDADRFLSSGARYAGLLLLVVKNIKKIVMRGKRLALLLIWLGVA